MLGYADFKTTLDSLELQDHPVIVHTSLKKFGPIEDGANTVIQALLDTTNGLMVPTFTYMTMVTPEVGPPNNGIIYGGNKDDNKRAEPFHLSMSPDKMMGILPRALLEREDSARTAHPILSFAGIRADNYLATQTLYEPLAPIGALAEQDGWVMLINVGHDVNTSIHYGEKLAGRKQFLRWAMVGDRIMECHNFPGDSSGFNAIDEYIKPDTRRVDVGNGVIQAIPLKRLFDAVGEIIKKNPLALLCQRTDCERCNAIRNM